MGHASRPRAIQMPTEVKRSGGRCVLWWRGRIRACGDPQWSGSVPGTGQALRRGVTANVGALTSEVVASRGRSLGRHGRDRVRGPLRRWVPLTASTTRICSSSVARQRGRSGACASLTWGSVSIAGLSAFGPPRRVMCSVEAANLASPDPGTHSVGMI